MGGCDVVDYDKVMYVDLYSIHISQLSQIGRCQIS